MGSHSVTCHPTQVNATRLTPTMQAGTRFTYPGGIEGWVDLVNLVAPRPGVEPATFRSRVRRRTAARFFPVSLTLSRLPTTLVQHKDFLTIWSCLVSAARQEPMIIVKRPWPWINQFRRRLSWFSTTSISFHLQASQLHTARSTIHRRTAYEPGGWGLQPPRLGQTHYFSGKS